MGISIRDPKVSELARELARLRKTNMTEAIAHALRSELERERGKRPLREQLEELARELKAEAGPNRSRGYQGRHRRDVGPIVFVDTSAIVAVLLGERDADALSATMESAGQCLTSWLSVLKPAWCSPAAVTSRLCGRRTSSPAWRLECS